MYLFLLLQCRWHFGEVKQSNNFFIDMPAFCGELLNTVVQSKLKVVVTEVEICETIF